MEHAGQGKQETSKKKITQKEAEILFPLLA